MSSATTILDAVELFGAKENNYFCVIHVNEIIGVLRYRDLFRPLGRLAFLALALEIEDQAFTLCQSPTLAERCWLSISANRKRKAIEEFMRRHEREPTSTYQPFPQLIACTHLVDKAHMIWKQKLIAPATRAEVLGFFHELKVLRDLCAHPGHEYEFPQALPQERLVQFIKSAKRMSIGLSEAMQLHDCKRRTEFTPPIFWRHPPG